MIPKGDWIYAGECLLFPVLWGLLIVAVVNRIEKFFAGRPPKSGQSETEGEAAGRHPISPEYHI